MAFRHARTVLILMAWLRYVRNIIVNEIFDCLCLEYFLPAAFVALCPCESFPNPIVVDDKDEMIRYVSPV